MLLSCGSERAPEMLWEMKCPMVMNAASGPPAASVLKHLQPEYEGEEQKVSSLDWPWPKRCKCHRDPPLTLTDK